MGSIPGQGAKIPQSSEKLSPLWKIPRAGTKTQHRQIHKYFLKIQPLNQFKVYHAVNFPVLRMFHNHHHHLIPEWLHNPKNKPSTQSCHAPFYPPLTLGNPCCLYAMAYFDISYEWNHTYVLLWLASFTFIFKVQSYCSRYQYVIPFCRLRAKSLQLYLTLCDPGDRSPSGSSNGFSMQEYWSGFWITFCCMAISH